MLDPACGDGRFLTAAAWRIAMAAGGPSYLAEASRRCVAGADTDTVALATARTALALGPGEGELYAGDAFAAPWAPGQFDLVIGNPPFLTRLRQATARDRAREAVVHARLGLAQRSGYADEAGLFLLLGLQLTRPGGRLAMVQPASLLAARDAEPIRADLGSGARLEHVWLAERATFAGAGVPTCAVVFHKRPGRARPARSLGEPPRAAGRAPGTPEARSWSPLVADVFGIPPLELRATATLGDRWAATADFRDEYYEIAGAVRDGVAGHTAAPLVTVGLLDPARCLWGRRPARIGGRAVAAPVVPIGGLGPRLSARLGAKVLVATQTRVIEAVVDPTGRLLPSVPIVTVTPRPGTSLSLWHAAAVLLSPAISAVAASRSLGTARGPQAIKLRAAEIEALPAPTAGRDWDAGAAAIEQAHAATTADAWRRHLDANAEAMAAAYGIDRPGPIIDWWASRLPPFR